jgi:hypothetical protein
MQVLDYPFHDYYHAFMVIEADDLTDQLKDQITINENDCYALVSGYCDEDGMVLFSVLAVGDAWDHCKKGLRRKAMLGSFTMADVFDAEAQRVEEPTPWMIQKNALFLKDREKAVDPDILYLRKDQRLDPLRMPGFADVVLADYLHQDELIPAEVCCSGTEGPFLTAVLIADEVPGHQAFEPVKCLPYMLQNEFRLLVVQAGAHPSRQEKERMERIRQYYEKAGVDFGGMKIRS